MDSTRFDGDLSFFNLASNEVFIGAALGMPSELLTLEREAVGANPFADEARAANVSTDKIENFMA